MADPYVNVHANASAIIWALARKTYNDTRTAAPATWIGRGWDPKSTEHATGRALDIIIGPKVGLNLNLSAYAEYKKDGDAIAAWLVKIADALNIRHIIWNEKIYRTRYKAWGPLPGRTSASNNSDWHRDHIHVYLENANGYIPEGPVLSGGASAPVVTPGLPSTGVSWDGKSFPGVSVFKAGTKHGGILLFQQRLKAHGFDPGALDGYWGPNTEAATRAFQLKQGWSGTGANGIPGPLTWTRAMAAVATKPVVSLSKTIAAFKADAPKAGTPISYDGILIVEAALVRENLLAAKYSDGHAGTTTRTAFSKFQQWLGYKGTKPGQDADGLPGMKSLSELNARNGFTVVA